ncbi:MAG: hypothetical protein LBQ31_05670 [Bacteroidales bacterium]|nr:hypothetical protein [Bacteroidales bacterium]
MTVVFTAVGLDLIAVYVCLTPCSNYELRITNYENKHQHYAQSSGTIIRHNHQAQTSGTNIRHNHQAQTSGTNNTCVSRNS